MRNALWVVGVVLSLVRVFPASAQALPTSQPAYLQITIEEVKVGHDDEHSRLEAGWVAAFERAKSPFSGIGLVALSGQPQAWFLTPFESHEAIGQSFKLMADDPVLAAEYSRLARADAAHVNNLRVVYLRARKELSRGAFPDIGKQRFYGITIFRVRPGHEDQFAAVAKAYGDSAGRVAPGAAYRVYEGVAGMTGPVYFVISSVPGFADFDKGTSDGDAIMKAMTKDEQGVMQKFATEGMINSETQRFRLDPGMSYVPKEVRASDPAFWNAKKAAPKAPTTSPQQ